jgi:hypothetical protein
MPAKAEASILGLPPGAPLAEATRTGYAQDGDRNTLVYETDAR